MEEKTPGTVISLLKFQMRSQQTHKLVFAKMLKSEIKTQIRPINYLSYTIHIYFIGIFSYCMQAIVSSIFYFS